jgi:hypothetical protein
MMHGSTNIKYHRGVIEGFVCWDVTLAKSCSITSHNIRIHLFSVWHYSSSNVFMYGFAEKIKNKNKTKKANWLGHVLSEKLHLKHGTEGKIKKEKKHERKRKKT